MIGLLLSLVILKRIVIERNQDILQPCIHLIALFFILGCFRILSLQKIMVRITPFVISLLSYYSHSNLLYKASGISKDDSCSQYQDQSSSDNNYMVKQVTISAAFFINHIYIDIFLTLTAKDSLALNFFSLGRFCLQAFSAEQLTWNSKLTILTLVMFLVSFSRDAKLIKDQITDNYTQQKNINLQWLNIFKKLPIGMIVSHDNKILYSNKKMHQIIGDDKNKFCSLEDLDQNLVIQDQDNGGNGDNNGCYESISTILNPKTFKLNTLKSMIGKVKMQPLQPSNSDFLESSPLLNESDHKFLIGEKTYTMLFKKIHILDEEMAIIIFIDISEQERLFKTSLEQKYKNIFLSSNFHQLRTPLNTLQLNNNTLRDLLKTDGFLMEILDQDHKTQQLLNYQIADILDFEKIETNVFKTNFNKFDVRALIEKLRDIFEPMAIQKKLYFNLQVANDFPYILYQDENRLGQILTNILVNAVKYTQQGTIKLEASVENRNDLRTLQFIVKDTGKGIANISQIFKWFGNLNIVQRVNQGGIGFGLTISKRLINALGGEIYIQNNSMIDRNQFSRGLSVTIEFPDSCQLSPQESISSNFNPIMLLPKICSSGEYQAFQSQERSISKLVEPEVNNEDKVEDLPIELKVYMHTEKDTHTLSNKESECALIVQQPQQPMIVLEPTSKRSFRFPTFRPSSSNSIMKDPSYFSNYVKSKFFLQKQQQSQFMQPSSINQKLSSQIIQKSLIMESKVQEYEAKPMAIESNQADCCNKILVVDDNPFNVKSIELMLNHCFNLECDTAFSGFDAITLVEQRIQKLHKCGCQESYPLILTDINMPELDGIQMTKKIRSQLNKLQHNQARCIIWAITAMNENEIQDMIGVDCLDGISVKPLSYKHLSDLLQRFSLIQ